MKPKKDTFWVEVTAVFIAWFGVVILLASPFLAIFFLILLALKLAL